MMSSAAVLLKTFRALRKAFRDRTKTVRLPAGITVRVQPGIVFAFTPESFSRSPRNPVHLAPESPTFGESLHLALEMGQPDLVAGVRTNLGVLAARRDNYAEASQHLQEALAIYRHLREPVGSAATLQYLGEIAYAAGDLREAEEQWSESRQLFASAGLVDRAQQVSQRLRDLGR
jgi:tetratricopeptide (TPR) repeat protein